MNFTELSNSLPAKDLIYEQRMKEIADVNILSGKYIKGEITLNQMLEAEHDSVNNARRILHIQDGFWL